MRKLLKALKRDNIPIMDYYHTGGGHAALILQNGKKLVASKTPSDGRAYKNLLATARRCLR